MATPAARTARCHRSDLATFFLLAAALILIFLSQTVVVEGFRFGRLPRPAEDRGRLTLRIFRFGRRADPPPVVAPPSSPPLPPQPQQPSVARVDDGAPEKGEQELARRLKGAQAAAAAEKRRAEAAQEEMGQLQQSWDATHRGLAEELATAKRAASEAEATARGLEEELGLLKGRLAAAGEEQARAVAAAAESEHELNEEIAALQVRMEEQAEAHEQALAAAKAEQELQERKAAQARGRVEELVEELQATVARLAQAELTRKEATAALAAADAANRAQQAEIAALQPQARTLRTLRRARFPVLALFMAGAPGLGFGVRTAYVAYAAGAWVHGSEALAKGPRRMRWGRALAAAGLAALVQVAVRPWVPLYGGDGVVLTATGSAVGGRALQKRLEQLKATWAAAGGA